MAYNESNTERVRKLLVDTPNVSERKMFGSIGFIVNEKLCIGVGDHKDHTMMVRVGSENYESSLEKLGAKPAIMRGKETKGYIFLEDIAFESDRNLEKWIKLALKYNSELTS